MYDLHTASVKILTKHLFFECYNCNEYNEFLMDQSK